LVARPGIKILEVNGKTISGGHQEATSIIKSSSGTITFKLAAPVIESLEA